MSLALRSSCSMLFAPQVEIEKKLRRQLLEIDEHSSHQARQLERLQEHTHAMHALAPGDLLPCPTSLLHADLQLWSCMLRMFWPQVTHQHILHNCCMHAWRDASTKHRSSLAVDLLLGFAFCHKMLAFCGLSPVICM